jgi:hypothetical protein
MFWMAWRIVLVLWVTALVVFNHSHIDRLEKRIEKLEKEKNE